MGMMGFKMHPIASVNGKYSAKLPKFLVHCGPDPFSTSFLLRLFHGLLRWFASCLTVSTVRFRHVHFISTIRALVSYYISTDSRFFIYVGLFLSFIMPHLETNTLFYEQHSYYDAWGKGSDQNTGKGSSQHQKSTEYLSCLLGSFCALAVFLQCS